MQKILALVGDAREPGQALQIGVPQAAGVAV
jgi:hypothetical protein